MLGVTRSLTASCKVSHSHTYPKLRLLKAIEQAIKHETETFTSHNWALTRIYGGMNGIVYRVDDAQSPARPLVVKIRKRDERQRALREFSTLQALKQASKQVGPDPISLHMDMTTLSGDVVIASWIEGEVLNDLSDVTFDLWERILTTLASCHLLSQSHEHPLQDAVLPICSAADLIAEIERRYAKLPDGPIGEVTKSDIGHLFDEFKRNGLKNNAPAQHIGLITCDMNPTNLIDHNGSVIIVDWENAGWGDPAFDVADLLVRPNCMRVSPEMRMRIISRYTEMMEHPELEQRIDTYERLMLIFWLILTSNGFIATDIPRFPGTRRFTISETRQQQIDYLQRIETTRRY